MRSADPGQQRCSAITGISASGKQPVLSSHGHLFDGLLTRPSLFSLFMTISPEVLALNTQQL
jgi:hypothetical protein